MRKGLAQVGLFTIAFVILTVAVATILSPFWLDEQMEPELVTPQEGDRFVLMIEESEAIRFQTAELGDVVAYPENIEFKYASGGTTREYAEVYPAKYLPRVRVTFYQLPPETGNDNP